MPVHVAGRGRAVDNCGIIDKAELSRSRFDRLFWGRSFGRLAMVRTFTGARWSQNTSVFSPSESRARADLVHLGARLGKRGVKRRGEGSEVTAAVRVSCTESGSHEQSM